MSEQPKVFVIHENDEWLPPLRDAFNQLGTSYEEWHLDKLTLDLDVPPPEGVFFSRMSASNYTRGHHQANFSSAIVLRWLEAHGRRVINGSQVLQLELSKPAQQLALAAAGFETPRTVIAVGHEKLPEAARQLGHSPFIIKPGQGGKGLGVQAFDGVEALEKSIAAGELSGTTDDVWMAQEIISSDDGFITRAEFVGGQFVYAVKVYSGGSFELCPADFCDIDPEDFCPANVTDTQEASDSPRFEIEPSAPDPIVARLLGFLSDQGIEVAGVEFIRRSDGTPVVYDINTNTNYNSAAERAAGLADGGMMRIASFLTSELNERYSNAPQAALA